VRLIAQRLVALLIALAFVAASGSAATLAQDDADIGPAGQPPIGTPVPFVSEEGNEIGLITVTEVVDPFSDFDPNSPPDAGFRFVEIGLQVEATGRRPLEFYPYYIYLQDSDGFLYTTAYLFRDSALTEERPDFTADTVAAGDSVTGYLYFSVFEDAEIVRVVYTDYSSRLLFLADLTAEGSVVTPGGGGGGDDEPTEEADPEATEEGGAPPEETEEPDTGDTGGTTLSAEECEDVASWYDDLNAGLQVFVEALDTLADPASLDAETARDYADQLAQAAEDQADADVPDAAQEANDAVVAALEQFAETFSGFADTLEAGDELTDDIVIAAFTEVGPAFDEATALIEELETACDLA
jgi:hypothetical protein